MELHFVSMQHNFRLPFLCMSKMKHERYVSGLTAHIQLLTPKFVKIAISLCHNYVSHYDLGFSKRWVLRLWPFCKRYNAVWKMAPVLQMNLLIPPSNQNTVHCLRHIWYTQTFRSWLYSIFWWLVISIVIWWPKAEQSSTEVAIARQLHRKKVSTATN